jgi:hypothetical protein
MLKLTVEDLYSKPDPKSEAPAFEMQEVKEISFKNDSHKLWYLNDEKKTLEYLQLKAEPDAWLKYQKRIEELDFQISSIFCWKKRSFTDKRFAKSAKEL